MTDMNGSAAIITGASSGLGRAITLQLASRGLDLWLVGRNMASLQETAAMAVAKGAASPRCVALDLQEPGALAALVTRVGAEHSYLFALINNAGLMFPEPILEGTPDRWRAMFETNVLSPVEANQAAVGVMRRHGRPGVLISISSIASRTEHYRMYSASKIALEYANRALRAEIENDDIRITTILPGGFQTNLMRGFTEGSTAAVIVAAQERGIDPMKPGERAMGDPAHVARTVEWVMDQPSTINVEEIVIRPPVTMNF